MTAPFVLSISNRKGGSGKSTTVVNLAAEWAARGRRVLVVDLDTQGHAGLGLGVEAAKSAPTVHDVFRDRNADILAGVSTTAWPNLWCVPADPLYDGSDAVADVSILRRQLRRSEMDAFDVIILDTPPSLDLVLTNAMATADGILIPFLAHALSAEGVKQLSRLFYRTATSVNPDLKMIGLLPVMASPRIGHHRSVIADISRQFGADRMLRPIRSDIQLAAAFGARKPIRYCAPRSRGALDYYLLADELASSWRWPERGRDTGPGALCAPQNRIVDEAPRAGTTESDSVSLIKQQKVS